MNSYEKINYVNGSEPSISAENLNHMDDGIEAATTAITKIETDTARKANTTEVNTALSTKADKTSVDIALALKANKSEVYTTPEIKSRCMTTQVTVFSNKMLPLISSAVTTIPSDFISGYESKARYIYIPSNVKTIQSGAFSSATGQIFVVIDNKNNGITVEDGAFNSYAQVTYKDTFNAMNYVLSALINLNENKADKIDYYTKSEIYKMSEIKSRCMTTQVTVFSNKMLPLISSAVTTIPSDFISGYESKARYIYIPSNVKTIQSGAFSSATGQIFVVIDNKNNGITVEDGAFNSYAQVTYKDTFNAMNYVLSALINLNENKADKSEVPDIDNNICLSEPLYKMLTNQSVNIYCFGDSTTAGAKANYPYTHYLQSKLRAIYSNDNINISNFGVNGRTSGGGLADVKNAFTDAATSCDIAIVMYGINDAAFSVANYSVNYHRTCMQIIVDYIKQFTKNIIICSSSITYGFLSRSETVKEKEGYENYPDYNNFIMRHVRSMALADEELATKNGLKYIDLGAELMKAYNSGLIIQEEINADEAHFFDSGYNAFADIIANQLTPYSYKYNSGDSETVSLAKSIYTITNFKTYQSDSSSKKIHCRMSGTDYIHFDFFNMVKNCKIEIYGAKTSDGAVMTIKLDDNEISADFSGDEIESLICSYDGIGYGYHRLTVDCAAITNGTYANPSYVKFLKY